MKRLVFLGVAALLLWACNDSKRPAGPQLKTPDAEAVVDTTYYGICGEGTTMNTLELKGDDGKLHTFIIDPDDSIPPVVGGLLAGDRMAVIGEVRYGDTIATKIINITTLQGKGASIDRNFELKDDGVVESNVKEESNPWTAWRITNGQLILGRDTFEIMELGADSLFLETIDGIYGFKRLK
jgi:hypothetical protein